MSARVRLLPALIGAAGVLMVLRLGAMASGTDQTPAPGQANAASSNAPAAANAPTTPPAASEEITAPTDASVASSAPTVQAAQPASAPASQAQTKGEAEVLQNLSQRRAELEARERDIGLREQLMSATEKRVSNRLAELKDLEQKLDGMLAQRDQAEEAQLTSLVKTYENMKPTDAANIFNKLDRHITLMVASRMKPAKIGAVMAAMDPARAQDLTVLLATRMNLPKPAPAAAPSPVPGAPPVVAPPQASNAVPLPAEPPHT